MRLSLGTGCEPSIRPVFSTNFFGALRPLHKGPFMKQDVYVVGVGMVPFTKPGASEPYPQMAAKAVNAALRDAGIDYAQVQQAYVGYVYGDSTAGQRALYEVGMTGIPVVNVNNNCSTGSTALFLARQAVMSATSNPPITGTSVSVRPRT